SRKEVLVEYGFRLPSALDNRPLKFEEWEQLAPQMIFVSATPGGYEAKHSSQVVEQVVRPTGLVDPEVEVRPVATQVDDVLSETNRRRRKQLEYNVRHGITPRGIQKAVTDIMEGARAVAPAPAQKRGGRSRAPADLRPEALVKEIKKLETEMYRRARNLEFEDAARLRDEIEQLKQLELGFPSPVTQT